MKSRLLVLTLIAAAFSQLLFAVPARRGWKDYRTDKGVSVTLQMVGDEFGHWLEDSQGTAYRLLDDGTVALSEKTVEQLSERRKASPRYRASRPQRTSGNINLAPRGIVILVNYKNLSMQPSNTQAAFNDMMNKGGYNYRNTHNSVREYFREQSRGAYVPDFDVYGPVTILNNYSYYGANDSNGDDMYPGDIVVEAVKKVDSQYDVDFSVYNNDGDDEIDFVYILYAGKGEADGGAANTIWPHNWSVSSAYSYGNCTYSAKQSMVDGLYINNYAMSGELDGYTGYRNSIGTICHEFGHVLGLPDLYDTSYGSNYNAKVTPNNYDIMDGGSYNGADSNGTASCGTCPPNYSPFERIYLGWDAPINPGTTGTNLTLYPSENAGYRCYQVNSGGYLQAGTTEAINYYIENRQQTGWDTYLPGHGMLVWKLDYNATYWSQNKPNHSDYGSPHCTLVSASGTQLTSGANTYPGTASVNIWSSLSNRRVTSITETGGIIRAAYMGGGTNTTIDVPCVEQNIRLTAGEIVSDAPYWTINVAGLGQQDNAIYRLKVEMNSSYIEGNFTLDNVRSFTSDYSVNNTQTYNTITPASLAATVTYSGNNTYQMDILVTDNNGMRYHYTMAATTTLPAYNTPLEKTVCKSELPVTWEGVTFDKADTKTTSLTATNRCDSVLTLTLNVLPSYANITDGATIWSSELPYTWEGEVFNEAGALTKTLKTVNGCDSVVTFTLTVQPSPDVTDITEVNANFAAHPFTVGDNEKRIVFSQGNLQYQASTQTYRFAYNQYDYMGASNAQIATDYTGWIDLFGWGTGTNPTLYSCTDCGTHFDYGGNMGNDPDDPDNPDYTFDAPSRRHAPQEENDYPSFADWGLNAVVNGGNAAGIWRTMTAEEWNYLFYSRENASAKFGFATISGVRGLVILPDDWEQPAAEYIFLAANDAGWQANDSYFSNSVVNSFTYNAYSTSQWAVMEAAGAVFLPSAGNRLGKTCDAAGKEGYYWSSTADEETTAFTAFFDNSVFYPATARARAQGHSVRLVKGYSLGSYTVTFMNGNEVLQSTEEEYGATPVYEGATPSKPADAQHSYIFAGWEPEITAVTGDATYQAIFTPELRKYTVTFMNGDVELQSSEVEYGATPVYEGEIPTKQADAQYSYIFAGWEPEITAVTGDATYQAVFTPELRKYTVTFMNGDVELQSSEVEYGATPAYEGATPSKQADVQHSYVFAGWEPEIVAVTGDATYQATFTAEVRKYTVTFMNGDVELQSSEVEYGTTPVYEGATPSKQADAQHSYIFAGWEPAITAVTGDATYQATFTAEVRKYTVTFYNYDGTTVLQSTEVEYGATPVYEGETPVKPADNYLTYTFIGWDKDIVIVIGDVEYTAVYSEEERLFTVTWQYIDEFNQQQEDVEQYSYGQKIDEPYDPYPHQSDGYHYYFTGWLFTGEGEPVIFDANLTVDGDKVFVAAYEAVQMYEITFYDNDGTTVLQTVWCDENALPAFTNPTPSRDGMVFAGWDRTVVLAVEATSYTATYAASEAAGDALQGGFSVSSSRKVRFAKGNLQYDLAEDSWSLARTQYDIIGLPNINLGDENFHGTIDMFAYSTESTNYGVSPSNADADYTGDFRDWGQLIGDGWFTLTKEEWVYLYSRKGGSLWGSAMVVDRKGLILLPDEWQLPEGLEFTPKYRVDDYEIEDLEKNKYTLDEWKRMEAAGAVFLPAAGRRTGGIGNTMNGANEATFINPATGYYSFMDNTDIYGYYWSSTSRNSTLAYYLIFNGDSYYQLPGVWSCEKRRGQSVRLAREALYTVIFTDGNGNMLGEPQTIAYGGAATAPDVEVPECSTFVWDKDFSRVTSDLTVNAVWTVTPVPAYSVTSEDNTKGTVTVTHSPASCLDLTLSFRADANDGYGFVQWSDGSTDNPRTLTLTQDTVITALFESVQPELPMDIILQETETNAYYDQFADDYEGVKVNTATLNRQFKQGVWSTLCLPFNVGSGLMTALSLRGRVYDFYHAEADLEEGGKVTLYFSQAKSMVAGRCYIVNANAKLAAIESFVFNAVTIDLTADKVSDLMVTDAYDGLDGHNDGTGTLSLIGTLRNGKVLSSEKGRYFGLSNNQIREANTTTGTTLRAYRGIFRSTIPVNAARVRIVVEGEPVTELEIIRDETQPSDEAQKFIHKGVLYIERNGKIYNAQGMRIE